MRHVTHELEKLQDLFYGRTNASEIMKDARSSQRYFDVTNEVKEMSIEENILEKNPDEFPALLRSSGSGTIAQPKCFRLIGKIDPRLVQHGPKESDRAAPEKEEQAEEGRAECTDSGVLEHAHQGAGRHDLEARPVFRDALGGDSRELQELARVASPASPRESTIPSSADIREPVHRGMPRTAECRENREDGRREERSFVIEEIRQEFRDFVSHRKDREARHDGVEVPMHEAASSHRGATGNDHDPPVRPAHDGIIAQQSPDAQPADSRRSHDSIVSYSRSRKSIEGGGEQQLSERTHLRSRSRGRGQILNAVPLDLDSEDSDCCPIGCTKSLALLRRKNSEN